jgi:hypothetical protein
MIWLLSVLIELPNPPSVTQDQITGAVTIAPPQSMVIYNGLGDMQHRRRTTYRDPENEKTPIGDADVYLADESNLWSINEGALITVTDSEDNVLLKGRVVRIDRLSGMLSAQQLDLDG